MSLGLCFQGFPAMSVVFGCDEAEHHSVRRSEVTYLPRCPGRGEREGKTGKGDGRSSYAMHSVR